MVKSNFIFLLLILLLSSCAFDNNKALQINKNIVSDNPQDIMNLIDNREYNSFEQIGIASWYGGKFNGRRTASSEIFNQNELTAAHKSLPFNSYVEVTNIDNAKRVIVKINDRGPFVKNRIIDLSKAAAQRLDFIGQGFTKVKIKVISLGNPKINY